MRSSFLAPKVPFPPWNLWLSGERNVTPPHPVLSELRALDDSVPLTTLLSPWLSHGGWAAPVVWHMRVSCCLGKSRAWLCRGSWLLIIPGKQMVQHIHRNIYCCGTIFLWWRLTSLQHVMSIMAEAPRIVDCGGIMLLWLQSMINSPAEAHLLHLISF